jgi:hypothetical protein
VAKKTLKLTIDQAVKDLEAQILKRHKKSITRFNKLIHHKFKNDVEAIDSLTSLPQLMLRESIEKALLLSLNGDKEFVIANLEI